MTGTLDFVGSTPLTWSSRRQSSIPSSTYAAEFAALCTATEEAIALRYMLRSLGCNIGGPGEFPTRIFGDNLSVILNSQNPAAYLSKKYVSILFHVVQEEISAGIVEAYWLKGKWKLSDIMTKNLKSPFLRYDNFLYWRPDFHLHDNNCLDENTLKDAE